MPTQVFVEALALPRIYAWFSSIVTEDTEAMDSLLAHGMPVDALHPLRHSTALLEAARLGRTQIVEWLLERDAMADQLSGSPERTPLHCVLRRRHWEIAAMLVAAMTDVSKPDALGRTALHLLCMDSLSTRELPDALALGKAIIRHGCALDMPDRDCITALHHCVINDGLELAELLLDHGAKVDVTVAETGVTPLVIAALEKNNAMCELLLRHGADPYHKTRDGARPASIYPPLLRIVMRAKAG